LAAAGYFTYFGARGRELARFLCSAREAVRSRVYGAKFRTNLYGLAHKGIWQAS